MSTPAFSTSTPGTTGDLADRLGLNPELAPEADQEAPEADQEAEGVPEGTADNLEAPGAADGEAADDAEGDDDDQDGRTKAAREAKKYRQKLAESKAENAVLVEHVAELQAEVVRGLVSDRLAKADDLYKFAELADVLDPDGRIDKAELVAVVDDLLKTRPYLAKGYRPGSGKPRMPEGNAVAGAKTPAPTGRRTLSEQLGIDVDELKMADLTSRNSEYQQSRRAVTRHEAIIGGNID